MKPDPYRQGAAQARASAVIMTALPIFLAVVMAVVSPSYFRPMVTSLVGWVMVFVAANLLVLGGLSLFYIVRRVQRGQTHPARAPLFMLAPMVVFIFPVLWIVLIGPALVVFLRPH